MARHYRATQPCPDHPTRERRMFVNDQGVWTLDEVCDQCRTRIERAVRRLEREQKAAARKVSGR